MIYRNFDELEERVKSSHLTKRAAVAKPEDRHSLEALTIVKNMGIVHPILLGDKEKISVQLTELGQIPADYEILDLKTDEEIVQKTAQLAAEGEADFIMKGLLATAALMHVLVRKEFGLNVGGIMSHVAFTELPNYHKLCVFSDGGLNISPDLAQKRQILQNALALMEKMGYQCPKVAILAAVETVNPHMQATLDAAELKRLNVAGEIRNCIIEGPLSYDLAFCKESAKIKGFDSPVCGDTDLGILPDMTAGNLMGKALTFSAKARSAGVIAGAKVPIVLVSRGAEAEEKYLSILLAAAAS